ncbi:Aspartate-semialdehyde dehydrogenase [Elusimicrobium minutum Pei191]|uniref:Aspartate-semialdehyde dehydrogenase n=1 Tax=Elusimicrobium minutum (strain Pei191) TaxID=445932 RepID=B2KAQ7_ELUMP|nr:Asd/ArgC dimerization domain-containing protein [Elusimicrobium minutum]ACC97603.1 Aspartate-semialdehyde dehydrogenase [Elusimicrobium minutum Pei191]
MIKVGIIGINGLVGQTLRKCLLKVQNIEIKEFGRKDALTDLDIAVLCTDNVDSVQLVEALKDKAKFIVDMSSEFRMKSGVPLVIPEINPETITKETQLIASPNCTVTPIAMALHALGKKYKIKEVFFCSYQALSGGGKKLVEEANKPDSIYNKNCMPQIGSILDTGYSSEELKTVYEARKILQMPQLTVYPHTVRVFVDNSHSLGITLRAEEDFDLVETKMLLGTYPGIIYGENIFTPKEVSGKDEVFICRLRQDMYDKKVLHFFTTFDNILKGAALNGAQIVEYIVKQGLV